MLNYRNQFKPSAARQTPYAILGVAAICAETEAAADRLAMSADLHFARRASGEYGPLASPEEAAAYPYTPIDRQRIEQNRKRLIVGSPAQVHDAHRGARRDHQGRRGDDHHDGVRPRGAQALV